jgi:hypothetical protein
MINSKFNIHDKVLIKSKSYGRNYYKVLSQKRYKVDKYTGYLIGYITRRETYYYVISYEKNDYGGGDYFLEKDLLEYFDSDLEFIKDEDLFI